jgi:hypothetical protein
MAEPLDKAHIVISVCIVVVAIWLWFGIYSDPGYSPLQVFASWLVLASFFLQWYLRSINKPFRFSGAFIGAWVVGPFLFITPMPNGIVILITIVPPIVGQALWLWWKRRVDAQDVMVRNDYEAALRKYESEQARPPSRSATTSKPQARPNE